MSDGETVFNTIELTLRLLIRFFRNIGLSVRIVKFQLFSTSSAKWLSGQEIFFLIRDGSFRGGSGRPKLQFHRQKFQLQCLCLSTGQT